MCGAALGAMLMLRPGQNVEPRMRCGAVAAGVVAGGFGGVALLPLSEGLHCGGADCGVNPETLRVGGQRMMCPLVCCHELGLRSRQAMSPAGAWACGGGVQARSVPCVPTTCATCTLGGMA